MLIGFIIWELVSLIFVAIALWCRRSEKPVGFWSNVRFEADRIGDVSAYNRAVSKLWLGFALVLAVLGLPMLLENSALILLSVVGLMLSVIAIMGIYMNIEKKFRIK